MNSAIIAFVAVFALAVILYYFDGQKRIIENAKYHGILIGGVHYKVYTVYRESSYTDGGFYVEHHSVKYFGEMMLISPKGNKIYISERHLMYCLKKKKHPCRQKIGGKWTYRWAEWTIDRYGDDERINRNDIYLSLY